MNLSAIKALIEAMAGSGLAEMTYSEDGWTLRLVRDPAGASVDAAPAQPAAAPAAPGATADVPLPPSDVLEAPLGGVVYFHPAPGAAPFVVLGSTVQAGDTLCVIEAMKVFNTVRAERGGTIAEFLVASGSEVEAGQPLVRLA